MKIFANGLKLPPSVFQTVQLTKANVGLGNGFAPDRLQAPK